MFLGDRRRLVPLNLRYHAHGYFNPFRQRAERATKTMQCDVREFGRRQRLVVRNPGFSDLPVFRGLAREHPFGWHPGLSTLGEAREVLAALPVDVVFVDVQLAGGESGLDLARSLPGGPAFVLATASSRHAREAWDLGIADYLRKPFSEERVEHCLRRIAARREARGGALRVVARRKRSLVFLDPAEIWAFEASDRLSFVHSRRGRFDIDLSLAAIESSFGRSLMRVHRNWLVNLDFVRELDREDGETALFVGASLNDGVRVPVSRDHAQPLRAALLANATGLRQS